MKPRFLNTYRMSILAVLTALLLIQGFVPMVGNLTLIPGLPAITTIHLTVIIGAIILGPRDGAILGTIWGITSLIRAYVMPTDPLAILIFRNPIIAILPRLLVGLIAGSLAVKLPKAPTKKTLMVGLIAIISTMVNTGLVIGLTWLFYQHQAAGLYHTSANQLIWVMLSAFTVNATLEIIAAAILVSAIATPLLRFKRTTSKKN
ncbi:ECF transporter S component [Latilactobacillus fuchuensis]|uniref:Membrane protein n=1 Tax=Latilactobacillus fuchuensis DSM 14340 = JCM 11249 TaxID=1423747 RepID=A0A0R1S8K0_9LACO|nr:ECF transporter S component [Latilactobacillus fuchuensis]KRL61819.1 membrane protein [Latilactobacillus fuchuensis DSM 14340 = JCM 11249]